MLIFFIDNIVVQIGGRVFQQTIWIPMGTNCPPLLVKLFLHAYEADFRQGLFKNNDRILAQTFNSSFHYIHLGDKSISRFVYTTSRHQKRMYFGCL
jgi:hypothetical protein